MSVYRFTTYEYVVSVLMGVLIGFLTCTLIWGEWAKIHCGGPLF